VITILQGDVREKLAELPDASVQCVVTSPPYWGLRDYGVPGQLGLEKTPDEYVANMVAVFRDVRRVLRDDGTLWLNLGDCYAKDKNRVMVPARVALALQSDGWFLRDEIVWHKPRTTPNSFRDRTVSAHEMLYLLTKSAKYYFDYLAIEEPSKYAGVTRMSGKAFRDLQEQNPQAARKRIGGRVITVRPTRRKRSVWSISPSPYTGAHFATFPPDLVEPCILAGSKPGDVVLDPFGGSGTTGMVAKQHGRDAILIELNPAYIPLIEARTA
jgi:DNA modification methylase